MGILPLQLAEFVGELAGEYLENLGPNASQQLVTFFKTEKFLSGADEALLEENPWVGIIGFGIGIIVTTALASPVGEISEGIGAAATGLAGTAVTDFFGSFGASTLTEIFGSAASAYIQSLAGVATSLAGAVINTLIASGATALTNAVAEFSPELADFITELTSNSTNVYSGTEIVNGINIPTNLPTWNISGQSTSYTIYNPVLTATPVTVTIQNTNLSTVQAIVVNSQSNVSLTLNYGNAIGSTATVSIGNLKIDPVISSPPIITEASDGSIVVDLPDEADSNSLIIDYENNGTVSLMIGADGATSGESLLSFAGANSNGDTVNVENPSGSTYQVVTDIGASDSFELTADQAVSGISQDFDFTGSNGILNIDLPSYGLFPGTIYGFAPGDTIDVTAQLPSTNSQKRGKRTLDVITAAAIQALGDRSTQPYPPVARRERRSDPCALGASSGAGTARC